MLVIRRKAGESFFVGNDVEVEILEVDGSSVKLGIRAPKEIVILRKEVIETRLANQAAACTGSAENLLERLKTAHTPLSYSDKRS